VRIRRVGKGHHFYGLHISSSIARRGIPPVRTAPYNVARVELPARCERTSEQATGPTSMRAVRRGLAPGPDWCRRSEATPIRWIKKILRSWNHYWLLTPTSLHLPRGNRGDAAAWYAEGMHSAADPYLCQSIRFELDTINQIQMEESSGEYLKALFYTGHKSYRRNERVCARPQVRRRAYAWKD